jgi:opacity protein-like surface antigen
MARSIRILTIVAAALVASSTARSADLLSPPPLAPAMLSSDPWSGPWVGVYGGWGFGSPSGNFNIVGGDFVNDLPPAITTPVQNSGAGSISANGGLVGVQGGWNLRLTSDVVVGVEADIGYGGLRGGRSASGLIAGYNAHYTVSQHYSTDWQGALRARAGYLVTPSTLLFVEAGPALSHMRYGGSFNDFVPIVNYSETEAASASAVKLGLTLGGGVEYMLTPNVSLRAEYLYTRFPSVNMLGTSNPLFPNPVPATVAHNSGALNQNSFRFGANYYLR